MLCYNAERQVGVLRKFSETFANFLNKMSFFLRFCFHSVDIPREMLQFFQRIHG